MPAGEPRGWNLLYRRREPGEGPWAGHAQDIAAYSSGGLQFLAPREGMRLDVVTSGKTAVYRSGVWEVGTFNGTQLMVDGLKVVGERGLAIAAPGVEQRSIPKGGLQLV